MPRATLIVAVPSRRTTGDFKRGSIEDQVIRNHRARHCAQIGIGRDAERAAVQQDAAGERIESAEHDAPGRTVRGLK